MSAPEVLVVGPASWNELVYVETLPEARPHTVFARRSVRTVGGTSAGKALNLAALGRRVLLRTVLGADAEAGRVARVLAGAGVETVVVPDPDGRTERHLNLMADDGSRLSLYLHAPADVPPPAGPDGGDPDGRGPDRHGWRRTLDALEASAAVVVDLAPHARHVLDAAAERGVPVWCDVHDWDGESDFHRPWVEAAAYLFLSSDRLPGYRDLMRARVDAGARLVVCTHGARGATALTADGWTEVDAVRTRRVVDTNGAGDGFFAGFLDAHLDGAGTADALAAAARHAARVVASQGLAPDRAADGP